MSEEKTKKPTKAEQENEALRQMIAEMQAKMEALEGQINGSKEDKPVVGRKKERSIPFINLTDGQLVLRGSRIYTIETQFGKRNFTEKEALIILNNMPRTLSEGAVYIADAQFVEDNDLAGAYSNILSDSQLKTLLDNDASIIVDTYQNVSEVQKAIIIDMIVDKREHEIEVDNNVLVKLSKLCGKDLTKIEPLEKDKK